MSEHPDKFQKRISIHKISALIEERIIKVLKAQTNVTERRCDTYGRIKNLIIKTGQF